MKNKNPSDISEGFGEGIGFELRPRLVGRRPSNRLRLRIMTLVITE